MCQSRIKEVNLATFTFLLASSPQWSCPERGSHAVPSWPVRSPPDCPESRTQIPSNRARSSRSPRSPHVRICNRIISNCIYSAIQISQLILSSFQLTEWTCWPSRFLGRRKGCWTHRCGCLWTPRAPSSSASLRLEPLDEHSKTVEWLCKRSDVLTKKNGLFHQILLNPMKLENGR